MNMDLNLMDDNSVEHFSFEFIIIQGQWLCLRMFVLLISHKILKSIIVYSSYLYSNNLKGTDTLIA